MKKALSVIIVVALILSCAALPSAAVNADDGLRVYYTFDDGTATDSSGNGLDGVCYGTMESVEGVDGSALYLKGGYIQMPETIIDGCTDLSISVWVNSQLSVENSRVWSIGSSATDFINLFAPLNENGLKYASALRINDNSKRIASTSATFKTNVWTNITVTYTSSSNGTITIFQDGAAIGSGQTGKKVSDLGKVTNALIGRSQFGVDPDYCGYVDDFRIYSKALTADQVAQLTRQGTKSLLDVTAEKLSISAKNSLLSLNGVMDDLTLPSAEDISESGAMINWKSSDAAVITDSGKIANVSKAQKATLTATITRAGESAQKSFEITVVPQGERIIDPTGDIATTLGTKPVLPQSVTANNGCVSMSVTWDEVLPWMYGAAGTYSLSGKVDSTDEKISVNIITSDTEMINPVVSTMSPDPFITYHDGYYYYVRQLSNKYVVMSKAQRIQDIGETPLIVVYTAPDSGAYSKEYWAPEMHFIDGNWYIYVAADNGNNANHRMFALECTNPDNAQAQYIMKGEVTPTIYNETSGEWEIDPSQDKWAIDGTVIQNDDGRNYYVWSGWEGNTDGCQNIYIAEMLNPWTIKGSRTLISTPDTPFETKGVVENSGGLRVNEGPQILIHNGKINVIYSAGFSGSDWYCLCMVSVSADSDLTDAASWEKYPGPLFTKSLKASDETYSTGHASFTVSPDGTEEWIVYHAFQTSGGGWSDRNARIKTITWDGDIPVLGNPTPIADSFSEPSGTPTAIAMKYEAETAELSGTAVTYDRKRASGGAVVTDITEDAKVTFKVVAPRDGNYMLSVVGNSRATSGTCYQTVDVNGQKNIIMHLGINNDAGSWRASSNQSGDGALLVQLNEGENTVTVSASNISSGMADIDYLYLLLDESGEVLDAESLIGSIGEVTEDKAELIASARESYDRLSTALKANVKNYDVLIAAEKKLAELTAVKPGDVDFDGNTTVSDVVALRKLIMGGEWTDLQLLAGDLDLDKKLTVSDVVALRKLIMG